jgi:hypothetical protein
LIVSALTAGGCRTAPIRNVTDARLNAAPGTTLTMDQVATAIWRAGQGLGWQINPVRPGELTGMLKLRSHVAVVSITHDTTSFNITYRESTNLLQSGQEIHKRYDTWVRNLELRIQQEVAAASAAR